MSAKSKFKSPAFEAIHSAASGLRSVNAISQETMRQFDATCLSVVDDLQPDEIKSLRNGLNISQFLPTILTPAFRLSRNGKQG